MHVLGLCFARQFGYATASQYGVSDAQIADFLSLDPATAATTFVRWWGQQGHVAAAVVWPELPPTRYAGLLKFLATQPNVFSLPPTAIKSQCGGVNCTVGDVIRTARRRHSEPRIETYEEAAASLAAGMCAVRHLSLSGERAGLGD